ncbi:PIN domain-containing protein [Thermodesulfovibrio yellowstonii]|uniref:PIN domain-containing protein n=1 Tax=Thermodesulfovibrio yellowstonii TaxID=28262 RepID=UPI000416C3EA|nr:PIN domain-containing protein [Thermodesulfovibrio islandicus]
MNENFYLLDTSFIVAFLSSKDVHHKRALELFEQTEGIFASNFLVFQETVTVICRRAREQNMLSSNLFRIINDFFNTIMIINEIPPREEILKIMENSQFLLSFTDASLIYYSGKLKAEILTFDNNLLSIK